MLIYIQSISLSTPTLFVCLLSCVNLQVYSTTVCKAHRQWYSETVMIYTYAGCQTEDLTAAVPRKQIISIFNLTILMSEVAFEFIEVFLSAAYLHSDSETTSIIFELCATKLVVKMDSTDFVYCSSVCLVISTLLVRKSRHSHLYTLLSLFKENVVFQIDK